MAAEDAGSRTGGKPARARRRARRAGTAKDIAAGSAVRFSTAQVGKAKDIVAGSAAPPAGGSAGQARAAASAAVPAGKVEASTLIPVGEIDGAATHIVLVAGQRHIGFS